MDTPRSTPPWAWAAVATTAALLVCWGALDGIPHVSDEVAYTLQSKLFAAGMRTGPAADEPSMVSYPFWVAGPKSHAAFPMGWPALLSVGTALGVPWLVNPLLAGVSVLLTWAAGRKLAPDSAARTAAAVVAVSPALVLLAASRMAHTSTLVALLTALWAVVDPRDARRALLGSAGVAYGVLARPFDALLLGGPLLVLAVWQNRRHAWAWVGLPALATAATLYDNAVLQGAVTTFPADAFYADWTPDRPDCNRLGFGADVGCAPVGGELGHTVSKALAQAWDKLVLLDRLLLGVPGGGVLALGAAVWSRRWLWLAPLALVVLGHLLYWSPGLAYGPRFYALGVPGLALLVGVVATRVLSVQRSALVVGAAASLGLAWVWPELSDRYWCVDGRLSRHIDTLAEGGVLFVKGRGQRTMGWPRLGVPEFVCDPMLESGDALWRWDPSQATGGWQVRHALNTAEDTATFRARHHPGAPAWLVVHDVTADERSVAALPPETTPPGQGSSR